jgi:YVTN family beta-propeller protein
MNNQLSSRNVWVRALLVAAFIVVAVGAWGIGRASVSQASGSGQTTGQVTPPADNPGAGLASQSADGADGYDIGVAGKPAPTGKVREFNLVAKEADVEIAPGVTVRAITYNGQVPGPTIRVTEGDTLRVTLKNELDKATTIHWHGLHVPNNMDGVPPLTQQGIEPGQSFTYEFPASHAGTFMYHSHLNAVEQVDRGLYGPLIIDPATPTPAKFDKEFTMMLSAWNTNDVPGMPSGDHMMGDGSAMEEQPDAAAMGGMNMNYNYFTVNGKAYPSNDSWMVKEGDLVRVRIINISNLAHPMHLHGHDFTVVAKDGEPIKPALQQTMNTLSVDAGETYDIVFRADNPGGWVFHCHELHHTENDGVEPGGLVQVIQYEGFEPPAAAPAEPEATPTPGTEDTGSMPSMSHDSMIQGAVWVADEHGNSLSVIDASTNKVAATLTGIEGPHNLQVAPDGKTVWAVSGHDNLAVKIDSQEYKVLGTASTGSAPAHIVLSPDGKTAYATNGGDDTVTAIDVATMEVVATIPVGSYPHGLRPSPDGKWLYVANAKGTALSVIDTSTNQKVADVEVGQKPVQVAFSPEGKYVYSSLNGENAVAKVDVAERKLVGKVEVGVGPVQVYVTPDARYLLAANQGTEDKPSTTVSIIDTESFGVVKTVESGEGAHGVVVDPSGKHAYITNIYGNDVAVLDIAEQKVIATIPVGEAPNGISFSEYAPAPAAAPGVELTLPGGGQDDEMTEDNMQDMP